MFTKASISAEKQLKRKPKYKHSTKLVTAHSCVRTIKLKILSLKNNVNIDHILTSQLEIHPLKRDLTNDIKECYSVHKDYKKDLQACQKLHAENRVNELKTKIHEL